MDSNVQENAFIFMMAIGILIMLALALAFILFFFYSQKKFLKEQMKNQQLAFEHQETLLHSIILTQEEERKRISRELHDEIGSKLNVILLNTHRLKKFQEGNEEMKEITTEVKSVVHRTIETTRRISHDLLPPTLEEFGLVEAIKELKNSFEKTGTVCIHFEVLENHARIKDQTIELNLFRVVQELVNNSIRHGEAKNITIHLWLKEAAVQLEYKDDGKGFDMQNFENKKGLGTKNIESRLNMIKANYQTESSPGNGFRLTTNLKLMNEVI